MFLPYHEPGIETILIQSSFLILLNVVNHLIDKLLYCGLLGQIFIGVAWGKPGGDWLADQTAIVNLGYLGLLLLVFEGGLTTEFGPLKANAWFSFLVALTGIVVPIGMSYVLMGYLQCSAIEAFAAGAALCSTSLGTTFTVLGTTGLTTTRMGVVLTSAAMLDDVVGLVMVQVITSLGDGSFDAVTVIRPVFVALAFIVIIPLLAWLVLKPLTLLLNKWRKTSPRLNKLISHGYFVRAMHLLVLIGLVTATTYAGTSNLLAAYISGALISWWDHNVPHLETDQKTCITGLDTFENYLAPALQLILKPFFFASIGFSIPIVDMFRPDIIWKGIVYALLMYFSKIVCGTWLLPIIKKKKAVDTPAVEEPTSTAAAEEPTPAKANTKSKSKSKLRSKKKGTKVSEKSNPQQPKSLYPAAILGNAMVARGEIGFLIASLAYSTDVLTLDIFLVSVWAIMLCTIIGPLVVGILVKRVVKLESQSSSANALGDWGVVG